MMLITAALFADVPEITALVNSAYRGIGAQRGWTSESHLLEGIRIDEEELQSYFGKDYIHLLKYTDDLGKIVGFVYLEKLPGNKLYLGMLTVQPNLQAAGIGRQLLAAAHGVARAQGCTMIRISVITSRHELIAWYERRGFKTTGEVIPLVTEKSVAKEPINLMIMEAAV